MRTEFSSEKEKHNYFNRMSDEQKLDAFGEILASCRHVAFLGGAGVSTESGIPDFRSKNGLYRKREKSFSKYKPEYLLSYDCLHKKPKSSTPIIEKTSMPAKQSPMPLTTNWRSWSGQADWRA